MENNELHKLLIKYGALDNKYRLKAILLIYRNPGISFNELARKIGIQRGLLAYHLGVLKAANLININPQREGRKLSHYYLTEEGEKLLRQILNNIK
ncbi:MAG: hypothetical protein DRJ34_04505 [Thermoprotei archaeon]|nr:MAG: hypothetical protein DRJ34_04505 [Thermoprotei archaeon]RLE73013.1 MAG: hypothetical protein DRJ45_00870 [Thermoprotei archaeon]